MAYDSRDGGGGPRDIPVRSRRSRAASDAYDDYPGGGRRSPPYPASNLTGEGNSRGSRNGSGGSDDRRRPVDDARDKVKEKDKKDKDRDRGTHRPRAGSDASEESVMGQYVKHRDGNVEFIPAGEGKGRRSGGDDNRRARLDRDAGRPKDDRDLYGGRAPTRRRPSYDDDYDTPPRGPGSRRASLAGAAAAGGGAGYAAGANRPRGPASRRQDDIDDNDSYTAPPRSRRWRRGSGHYDDLGYDSERPRPTRRPYNDDDQAHVGRDAYGRPGVRRPRPPPDRYDRRRYDDDEDVYYGGRRAMIDDDRSDGLRRSKSDRRGPERDRRRGDRDRRDRGDKNDWKQQGLVLFQTAALPLIKKEGGRFVKKSLESFLASQGR